MAICKLRATGDGNCVVLERIKKRGGDWLILMGFEHAPKTGREHIQVKKKLINFI